jgi:HEAT repeat protein
MQIVLLSLLATVTFAQTQSPAPAGAKPATPEDRSRSQLQDALKDSNPDVRTQAVQALGLVGPREPYLSELEGMLDDKDVAVRLATVASLVDLRNPRTPSVLKKALADDVPEVSFSAAKALWNLNEPEGKDALLSVLAGEMKTSSGFITKQKRDTFRLIHTPKTMFLFALKEGMGFAPVPGLGAGAASLQGILADPSVSGRATTALLLSNDRDPRVLDALRDALGDKDASVRAAAVHAIALRDDPTVVNDLAPMLDDKKEAVRVRAAAALLRLDWIKSQKPKPALKKQATRSLSSPPARPAAK